MEKLHLSRGQEYLFGQILGISVAMGSVWAGRNLAPQAMEQVAQVVSKQLKASHNPLDNARQYVNVGLMFAGGLATSLTTQTILSRKRRDEKGFEHDVSVGRDVARLMAGWGVGCVGAMGSYYLAKRYGSKQSKEAVTDILDRAEQILDRHVFRGAELYQGNTISEGLVANLVMVPGGLPFSILGQKIYDELYRHPAYHHEPSR